MNSIKIKRDCKVTGELNPKDREIVVDNLILAYEFARKNALKGNMTSSSFGCGLVLDDNSVHFGVNFNDTRNEISSICAERMALISAFCAKLRQYEPNKPFNYKIKYILMASYTDDTKFWTEKITPCADCLAWFNANPHLGSDTKIIFFKKDDENEPYLFVQKLEDFLPLRNLSTEVIDTNKIIRYQNAVNSAVSDDLILKLYKKVHQTYKKNILARTSGQNSAAGLISNGEIFTGAKVDFSKRWFIEPLMAAFYKAVEKFGNDTKIDAICLIGDEYTKTETGITVKDGLISLKTLGRLNIKYANPNTLVATCGKEGIEIRTISDFMPSKHKFIHGYDIH